MSEAETSTPVPTRSTSRSLLWLVLVVAGTILLIDQLTKVWAVARLEGQPPIEVVGELLSFTLVRNPGAAFSFGGGYTFIFSLVAIAIAVFVVYKARQLHSIAWAIALGGVLGGAVGNLTDRIFRDPGALNGAVVDFIAFPNFPVFNVADMAVVGSAGLIILLVFRGVPLDPSTDPPGDTPIDAPSDPEAVRDSIPGQPSPPDESP